MKQSLIDQIKQEAQEKLNQKVEESNRALAEARLKLDAQATATIQKLLDHRDSSDPTISLNAAKYLAKIQGFEIERHEHEHKGSVVVHSNIPMGFDDEVGK